MVVESITTVFGPALIGIILETTLYGIYCSQAYLYFNHYSKDKLWMKLLVTGVWVVLSLEYAFYLRAIYVYLVLDFSTDSISKLAVIDWDWVIYFTLTAVTSIIVQLYLAQRLFHLLENRFFRWIVLPIVILSFLQFAFGLYLSIVYLRLKLFSAVTQLLWAVDMWLGVEVACDTLITAAMVYALHTSRTGIKRTDRLINKLIAYSVPTGGVTSLIEIFCLATVRGHWFHVLLIFPVSGLYGVSLLANLHIRTPNSPTGPSTSSGLVISGTDIEMSGNSSQATKARRTQFQLGSQMEFNDPTSTAFGFATQDDELIPQQKIS